MYTGVMSILMFITGSHCIEERHNK